MIQLDKREAFPFSSNPFGLVYENAITENKENEVQIHPITYQLNGIKIASNRKNCREWWKTAPGSNYHFIL